MQSTTTTNGASEEAEGTGFAELGLREELLAALNSLGYEEPTPIQREAIPPMLAGSDILGQAATGTGKTAAFALPILERLAAEGAGDSPMALVLVPTRELAVQVATALHRYGRGVDARVLPIYGGQSIGRQINTLTRGVDIVVATPGRALDHISRGTLALTGVRVVVLDEADEMLDMGFLEDIEAILDEVPEVRQTVLFSATLPRRIESIAAKYLRDPQRIAIGREPVAPGESPAVRQSVYVVPRSYKVAALGRVLDSEAPAAALVFCRTRNDVDGLTESLNGRGYRAEAMHGGMSQEHRDRIMKRVRSGAAELLIATDVAARGLDIDVLTHVINYDLPSSAEVYVHRIGRVGRAGREGTAVSLAEPREHRMIKAIEHMTRQRIQVERLPTVADVRSRRLELTRAALRELILEEDFDGYRVVVDALCDEFDPMTVAMAAVKMAHDASSVEVEEEHIPDLAGRIQQRHGESGRGRGPAGPPPGPRTPGPRGGSPGMSKIFVSLGRQAGIRPQDIVGAIANGLGIHGRAIGAIEIAERFSLVEIADEHIEEVIEGLGQTRLKGRRPKVERAR